MAAAVPHRQWAFGRHGLAVLGGGVEGQRSLVQAGAQPFGVGAQALLGGAGVLAADAVPGERGLGRGGRFLLALQLGAHAFGGVAQLLPGRGLLGGGRVGGGNLAAEVGGLALGGGERGGSVLQFALQGAELVDGFLLLTQLAQARGGLGCLLAEFAAHLAAQLVEPARQVLDGLLPCGVRLDVELDLRVGSHGGASRMGTWPACSSCSRCCRP
ncbi:MAG: hypothetical protein JSS18_07065 [Proteobacteria bacterium]|nr:hypothetical protein [Pseudomonadota bacterium]